MTLPGYDYLLARDLKHGAESKTAISPLEYKILKKEKKRKTHQDICRGRDG